jgi:hypothetical protein
VTDAEAVVDLFALLTMLVFADLLLEKDVVVTDSGAASTFTELST